MRSYHYALRLTGYGSLNSETEEDSRSLWIELSNGALSFLSRLHLDGTMPPTRTVSTSPQLMEAGNTGLGILTAGKYIGDGKKETDE